MPFPRAAGAGTAYGEHPRVAEAAKGEGGFSGRVTRVGSAGPRGLPDAVLLSLSLRLFISNPFMVNEDSPCLTAKL
ncbi:MAG: hypothetical protein JWM36_1709 [Hyphomicrobiales bacterium]|nr:hypothetical protein [Hyphomicrobiales bacterium]